MARIYPVIGPVDPSHDGLLFPIRIPRIQETSVIQLIDGLCGDLEPHDRDVNRVKDVAEDTVWD